mmetsp:Transcript_18500/g.26282  ORF Transcript_18500/g.26282 Transcript_18500/m.26282 type:complete len:1165 (-) Transcript_18500:84-3578(-)
MKWNLHNPAFLILLLHSNQIMTLTASAPFAYQSDSSKSYEFSQNGLQNPGDLIDPSSFAGSIHYDARHHSLFITGATYASSFDGVDAYLVNAEKQQLTDNNPNNDGYWWNDKETGLHPHMGDPGVPGYSPKKSDCFYAVMALPGDNTGNSPKVVHSRRFGTENVDEACSAMDILFSDEVDVGEFMHGFEQHSTPAMNDVPQQQPSPPAGISSPTFTNTPGGQSSEFEPTYEPTTSDEQIGGTDVFGGARNLQETRSVRLLMAGHVESPDGQEGYTVDALLPLDKRNGAHVYAFAQQVDVRLPSGFSSDGDSDSNGDAQYEYNLHEQADVFDPNFGINDSTDFPSSQPTSATYEPTASDGLVNTAFDPNFGINDLTGDTNFPSSQPTSATYEPTASDDLEGTTFPSSSPSSATYEPTGSNDIGSGGTDFFGGGRRNKDRALQGMSDLAGKSVQELQEEFEGIVTSGVDARCLLDDRLPTYLNAFYPVSLVGDPTTKKHYYVASLASRQRERNDQSSNNGLHVDPTIGAGASQRSWTDFVDMGQHQGTNDHFGGASGRPNYGKDYMVILEKVAVEGVNRGCVDENGQLSNCAGIYSNTEQVLSSKGYDEKNIAMKQEWFQEYEPEGGVDVRPSGLLFAPSGDPTGKGDTLIMVGTTSGFGNAFGMAEASSDYQSQDSGGLDLDGFIMKIRTDTGVFAGHSKFDPISSSFVNMHSHRIQSLPMKDDIVAGVCSKPLQLSGNQEKMRHIYVVGSTESVLPGIATGLRGDKFLSDYPVPTGKKSMEAFLMKVDLDTLDTVWTVQLGAIYTDGVNIRGNAFGFGCAVTPDGDDIYLTGMVNQGGLVTDFSTKDSAGIPSTAKGGTDVFIASYKTNDGSRNYVRQVGSTRDDFPSRGDGGITADRLGNAIFTGHTRGSIARKRGLAEYKYGDNGAYAAADIFVMSFDRATGNHVNIADDGVLPPDVTSPGRQKPEKMNTADAAIVGVVAITLSFVFAAIAGVGIVIYKIKKGKKKQEDRRFMSTNLRERRQSDKQSMRRRSTWGMKRKGDALSALQDLNVMVEVRNSASGGWHGVYDDDQLQVIDFGMSTGYRDNVVEQSLFMEDDLKEIEEASSIDHYEIGDIEDVSDEDLIKAYNDAMAVDIEPENPDLDFTMAGLGSQPVLDEDHHIT